MDESIHSGNDEMSKEVVGHSQDVSRSDIMGSQTTLFTPDPSRSSQCNGGHFEMHAMCEDLIIMHSDRKLKPCLANGTDFKKEDMVQCKGHDGCEIEQNNSEGCEMEQSSSEGCEMEQNNFEGCEEEQSRFEDKEFISDHLVHVEESRAFSVVDHGVSSDAHTSVESAVSEEVGALIENGKDPVDVQMIIGFGVQNGYNLVNHCSRVFSKDTSVSVLKGVDSPCQGAHQDLLKALEMKSELTFGFVESPGDETRSDCQESSSVTESEPGNKKTVCVPGCVQGISQVFPVSLGTVTELTDDDTADVRSKKSSSDDSLGVNVITDDSLMQEQIKLEMLEKSNVLSSEQMPETDLQGMGCEDVTFLPDVVGDQHVLERTSVKADFASLKSSLAEMSVVKQTSSDVVKQTSSSVVKQIQNVASGAKSFSGVKKNETLLKFLRQNGISVPGHGSSSLSESPCKVVTKYVFINKRHKSRVGRKSFGVLYRQAFRHFHGAKVKVKTKKPHVKQKVKQRLSKRCPVTKNNSKNDFIFEQSSRSKKNKEARDKSREERRIAREMKKNASFEKENERKKQKVRQKRKSRENKVEEKDSKKIRRRKSCKEKQQVQKNGKIFGAAGRAGVVKFVRNCNEVSVSVGKGSGITRRQVRRLLRQNQENLINDENKEQLEAKRRKKQKKSFQEETKVEIKEENMDGDVGDCQYPCHSAADVDVPSQYRRLKLRNRKDLTLQEKVQAIGALEVPGSKLVAVAKRFGVSVSAISRINKNKEHILMQSVSGDLNNTQRRIRECKDPELDKVLFKWYRAVEHLHSGSAPFAISNVLLKEKVHEIAITMGKSYFPSDNWIIRWKNRHNIGNKSSNTAVIIQDREEFKQLDSKVSISEILEEMGKQEFKIDQVKQETLLRRREKPEELFVCEHCGVLTSSKKKKENNHLPGCPASSVRKDLTLAEKVQVVRALEQPGMKMVTLAKRYGVSASAISRIHKNRVDILARRASGLANCGRRRDRGSKEPEVEKALCEWFKVQHELGIHISGSMIREKAREIAKIMGKDFWPSESWVFRWRHRNNVTDVSTFLYADSDEGDLGGLEKKIDDVEGVSLANTSEGGCDNKNANVEEDVVTDANDGTLKRKRKEKTTPSDSPSAKQFRLPRSVMCEKCGFVSCRVKNNRIKSLRHAKGCPDLKPRNELTYENRAQMLKALEEPGATLSSVARQFGVSVSSMSRMNQKKQQIFSHCEDHAGQKRIRDCKEPEVAHSLYQWYMEKKAEGIHITGPKLKEKARKIAAERGREFSASSGWLGRWRNRYNITNNVHKISETLHDQSRRRKSKKSTENKDDSSEHLVQMQVLPHDLQQDSLGSTASVIVEPLDPVPPLQSSQTGPVFIHQRFQNPWEITQQQANACVWTKEFLTTAAGPGILDEAAVSVAYTYGDAVSKPVFHNMFDSFSAVGYQVAMPVESGLVSGRDYVKSDNNEDKCASGGAHLPHSSHPSHDQLQPHLPATQQHVQHHIPVTHPHSLTHQQQPQVQPNTHVAPALPSPSPLTLDDDPEQHRQVMEAIKIMSSFAQKRSLGDQVQAALRTIEMSMRGSARKASSRSTYTSI